MHDMHLSGRKTAMGLNNRWKKTPRIWGFSIKLLIVGAIIKTAFMLATVIDMKVIKTVASFLTIY